MRPPPAVITGYADHIITAIDDDIAEGALPARVRDFAELHDYLDANDYLQAAGVPESSTPTTIELIAAVQDEVTRRLRAPGRSYCTFGTCAYPKHDHSTTTGPDGEDLTQPVGMRCDHCDQPAHYDEQRSRYQHDDPTAEDCYLITGQPTPSQRRTGFAMKDRRHLFIDYLTALTLHAGFTIDHDEVDIVAQHPDLVSTWVHAAARHAAAACLQDWVDTAIDMFRDVVTAGPTELLDHHVETLAALLDHRRQLDNTQRGALTEVTTTCQTLTGAGCVWPTDPATTAHHDGQTPDRAAPLGAASSASPPQPA